MAAKPRRRIKEYRSISPSRVARESTKKSPASEESMPATPKTATGKYLELFRKYLAEAEELYRKGDLPQSGKSTGGPRQPSSTP
jgi:hypothetical protein